MRLIDAEPLAEYLFREADKPVNKNPYEEIKIKTFRKCFERLLSAPTVDAVRVVRCKDCKRHEDEEPGMVYCPLQIGGWRHENWFCAAGERIDNE